MPLSRRVDFAALSQAHDLYFCGKKVTKYITHMAPECVADHPQGQLVLTSQGIFVSARLPAAARLNAAEITKLTETGWSQKTKRRGPPRVAGDSHEPRWS